MRGHEQGGGAITGVRFFGSPHEPLRLVEGARIFTIGSGACDLVVPEGLAHGVAPVHATIERIEAAIRVRDLISRHGLYRSPHLGPVVELLLHAGEVGWVGRCAILAVDERMEELRSRLAWSMGLDAHLDVDQAIGSAVGGSPVALVGPPTLDATPLARAIHC